MRISTLIFLFFVLLSCKSGSYEDDSNSQNYGYQFNVKEKTFYKHLNDYINELKLNKSKVVILIHVIDDIQEESFIITHTEYFLGKNRISFRDPFGYEIWNGFIIFYINEMFDRINPNNGVNILGLLEEYDINLQYTDALYDPETWKLYNFFNDDKVRIDKFGNY